MDIMTKTGAPKYFDDCYQQGYEEGYKGQNYSGKTFIGYYGWLDGKEKSNA